MDNTNINFNEMITKDEFFKLSQAIKRDGEINETELEKLVNWVTEKRCGASCADLVIEGFLKVEGWDGNNPNFKPVEDDFDKFLEIEIPLLEESRC